MSSNIVADTQFCSQSILCFLSLLYFPPSCLPAPPDLLSLVRPGPAESVRLVTESEHGLTLTYSTPRDMNAFPVGLDQEIRVSNEHQDLPWEVTANWDKENNVYQVRQCRKLINEKYLKVTTCASPDLEMQ